MCTHLRFFLSSRLMPYQPSRSQNLIAIQIINTTIKTDSNKPFHGTSNTISIMTAIRPTSSQRMSMMLLMTCIMIHRLRSK